MMKNTRNAWSHSTLLTRRHKSRDRFHWSFDHFFALTREQGHGGVEMTGYSFVSLCVCVREETLTQRP